MAVRSPQDVIAKNLSSSRGYPLWTPEQSLQLTARRPEGLRIGDVGVVTPGSGSFDCFFNICLPSDHAGQPRPRKGVPEGFSHIELKEGDIRSIHDAEPPGSVIKSASVKNVEVTELPAVGDASSSAFQSTHFKFKFSSPEGAILILPEGAERHEVKDLDPFFEQAAKNAVTWYRFGKENLGRIMSDQSLYVITGFYKARFWSVAGFQKGLGEGDSTGDFRFSPQSRGGRGSTYITSGPHSVEYRFGDTSEMANQTVFIQGFKIALRSAVRGYPQRWSRIEPAIPHAEGWSWLANIGRELLRTLGLSDEDPYEHMSVQIDVTRIPEILPIFHPSEVINQYLLLKNPSASVAITHDSVWGSLLDEELIQPEHLVKDERLEEAVSEHYEILSQDGVAYLKRKPESTPKAAPSLSQPTEAETDRSESLNVVSSSNYRCTDDRSAEIRPEDLLSLPASFAETTGAAPVPLAPTEPRRVIKIMIISDYLCSFCYLIDKVVHEAITACQDLPIKFDVEFRPFTLLSSGAADSQKGTSRNDYIIKKFGQEEARVKLQAVTEMAQKAGLTLSADGIICRTIQAQRLSVKAYEAGGHEMQRAFNSIIFKACLEKGQDISDEDLLADAANSAGLMSKAKAIEYLRSTEDLDRVEKMIEAAKAQGVNGVPFVIIDGKWAVNGVQPEECFIQIFRKLASSPVSPKLSGKKKE